MLTYATSLEEIVLSISNLSDADWENIWKSAGQCSNLKSVSVQSYFDYNFSSLEYFKYLPKDNVLQKFTINVYTKEYEDLVSLSGLENLKNLKTLSINKTNVSDITALENLINLTSITITNSKVSEVYSLRNLSSLTYLNLTSNSINETASVTNVGTINNLEVLINLHEEGSLSTLILTDNLFNTESDNYKKLISLDWSSSSSF